MKCTAIASIDQPLRFRYRMRTLDIRDVCIVAQELVKNDTREYLTFDLPPSNKPSDGLLLAMSADAVLLVIEVERVLRQDVLRTRRRLEDVGANVVGMVFNEGRQYVSRRLRRLL